MRKLGRTEEAAAWIQENLALDPFDFLSGNEQVLLAEAPAERGLKRRQRCGMERSLAPQQSFALP